MIPLPGIRPTSQIGGSAYTRQVIAIPLIDPSCIRLRRIQLVNFVIQHLVPHRSLELAHSNSIVYTSA